MKEKEECQKCGVVCSFITETIRQYEPSQSAARQQSQNPTAEELTGGHDARDSLKFILCCCSGP